MIKMRLTKGVSRIPRTLHENATILSAKRLVAAALNAIHCVFFVRVSITVTIRIKRIKCDLAK